MVSQERAEIIIRRNSNFFFIEENYSMDFKWLVTVGHVSMVKDPQ